MSLRNSRRLEHHFCLMGWDIALAELLILAADLDSKRIKMGGKKFPHIWQKSRDIWTHCIEHTPWQPHTHTFFQCPIWHYSEIKWHWTHCRVLICRANDFFFLLRFRISNISSLIDLEVWCRVYTARASTLNQW